jgi:hypothetical protein
LGLSSTIDVIARARYRVVRRRRRRSNMTGYRPTRLIVRALLLVVALLAPVLPAGAQGPSPSPVPSPAPSPAIETLVAEVLAGGLASLTTPGAVSDAGRELVALDRERLAAIDPGLPAALDELEAGTEAELAAWLETVLPSPESLGSPAPSPLAAASPDAGASPAPEGAGRAFLAAVGPPLLDPERVFDQGASYLASVGQVAGMVSEYVAAAKPDKLSSRDPAAPFVRGSTRFEVRNARVRDTLTIGITIAETYEIPSRTPGQPPITVSDAGEATVIVDVCPDEDGTVVATATTSATVDAAGNGLTYRVVADADDRALATVDGEANVASVAHTGSMSRHATGDRAVFASGGEGSAESHLEGSTSWTTDGAGSAGPSSVEVEVADGANEADIRAWALTRALAASLTDGAISAAATVWRGGRCLELVPDPPGQEVDPGSETTITVKIEHKAHDEEVERPIRATFAGVERAEELETPIDAPADFTYTAATEPQTEGTITWRSVSNRGIAERSETYRVAGRLLLDVDMTVTYRQASVSTRGTIRSTSLRVTPIAGDAATGEPPGVTVEGDLAFRGRSRSPDCSGSYRGAFPVDAAKNASATIAGEGEDRRLVVSLRLADPSASLTARVRCRGGGVSIPIPLGRMLPRIGVELPLAGGTVSQQGNESGARWRATFTLRVDRPR